MNGRHWQSSQTHRAQIDAWIANLGSANGTLRGKADKALKEQAQLPGAGKSLMPALYKAMRNSNDLARVLSARVAGTIDPNDLSVVSVLLESLGHKDPSLRRLSAQVLGEIRPNDEAVIEFLSQASRDPDAHVRQTAAEALKKLKK